LDDFLHRDALRATLPPKMRENAFRRYRLGQWVAQDDAWLPDGAWAACTDATRSIPDGADVVLAFDGSFSRDCSVLVAATIDPHPHVELVELWEAPEGRRDWRVPVIAVEDAIRAACSRWRVLEVAADPYRWQRSLEVLDGDGIPVHEFFQTAARMGPATARFYQLVVDLALTHDGSTALARHVANAILREDSRGARLSKETKDSPRRIDGAVAAVMAVHRRPSSPATASPASTSRRTAALGGARTDRLWARPAAARRVPRSVPTEPRWAVTAASGPRGLRSPGGRTPTGLGCGQPGLRGRWATREGPGEDAPGPPTY
jgi:phage terminase large subunit-like protein